MTNKIVDLEYPNRKAPSKLDRKADAEKTLIENITKGGQFGWKQDNMPGRGLGANDTQIAALAKFIAVDLNK